MTTTEHPDVERIRDVVHNQDLQQYGSVEAALEGWVDPGAMRVLLINYLDAINAVMRKRSANHAALVNPGSAVEKVVSTAFATGFLTGAQFQAAGGHREPATQDGRPSRSEIMSAGLDGTYGGHREVSE
jgi:hypothetical protein